MSQSQKNTNTVKVKFSDHGEWYYVNESLMALKLGWLSVKKYPPEEKPKQNDIHPLKGGIEFDGGEYFRKVLDFRFWKVNARSGEVKELSMHDELVKDYIDAALGNGWHPLVDSENIREDQREEEKRLDAKIRSAYGYE